MTSLPTLWTKKIYQNYSPLADRLKALGASERLRILNILWRSPVPLYQREVTAKLGTLAQPTVSHHLGVLVRAGLVSSFRSGHDVAYSLNRDGIDQLAFLLELPPIVGAP